MILLTAIFGAAAGSYLCCCGHRSRPQREPCQVWAPLVGYWRQRPRARVQSPEVNRMVCAACGEVLAQEVVQSEARWLAHRLLKHQSPTVQAAGVIVFTIGGLWGLSKLKLGKG